MYSLFQVEDTNDLADPAKRDHHLKKTILEKYAVITYNSTVCTV